MKSLLFGIDENMKYPVALPVSDSRLAVVLVPGQAKVIAVPPGARLVLFSATANFWARLDGSVQVPSVDILDGDAPELNPAARLVGAATTIGLAAETATTVTLVFFG